MNLNQSNLFVGKEAQDLLKYGIDGVADAVKLTIGAKGRNAILQDMGKPGYVVTNDGISISSRIHFKDPVAEMGADIIREVGKRADDQSGDGTTTATVLAQAIINEGFKARGETTGLDIKRQMEALIPTMESLIDEQSKPCETPEDIKAVARISAESEELGDVIAEIYQTVGKNGFAEVENAGSPVTEWEEIKGIRFWGAKMASPMFAEDRRVAIQESPLIFITTQPLRDPLQLKNIFSKVHEAKRADCVLIVDEMEEKILQFCLRTNAEGGARIIIVKAPSIDKDAFFEDIAEATGATILNAKSGVLLDKAKLEHSGTCERITVTLSSVTVRGGKDLTEYRENLEKTLDPETPLLKDRLARLSARVGILKVGYLSESDLSYKKAKALDAVNAVKIAMNGGMVAGGGVALLNVSNTLTDDTVGARILKEALKAPIKQIVLNAGMEYNQLLENGFGGENGFNAKTGEIVNMWEANIVDALTIVKNSLRSAVSVAGTILSADVVTILPEPKQQFMIAPPHA